MVNKMLTGIVLISLVGIFAGLAFTFILATKSEGQIALDFFLTVGQASGILLLLRNGTILTTIYLKIICLLFCFVITGTMIKIMHWKFADIILLASLVSIAITYLIRFILKKKKSILDFLKVFWVTVAFISSALFLIHFISKEMLYLGNVFLWVAIIYQLVLSIRQKMVTNSK